jgi:PIN domain nuclease of toxin-antitoxin system
MLARLEAADQLAVSAISCWEVAWLVKKGRLGLAMPLDQWITLALADSGVACLPVDGETALLSAHLPEHHRDPADRMIIATAIRQHCLLASLDSAFGTYDEISDRLIAQ